MLRPQPTPTDIKDLGRSGADAPSLSHPCGAEPASAVSGKADIANAVTYRDHFTGKVVDHLSDLLPRPNGQHCEHCGGPCIDRCMMCGAPQCCPACCIGEREAAAKGDAQ